jgi:hypothetical protein
MEEENLGDLIKEVGSAVRLEKFPGVLNLANTEKEK